VLKMLMVVFFLEVVDLTLLVVLVDLVRALAAKILVSVVVTMEVLEVFIVDSTVAIVVPMEGTVGVGLVIFVVVFVKSCLNEDDCLLKGVQNKVVLALIVAAPVELVDLLVVDVVIVLVAEVVVEVVM